jgi:outer membrane protein OmpA-like peptidoglycan-associated protein
VGFSQENTHTVYFDTDLSKVTSIEENRLLSFVASLSEKNVLSIEIFGFCDDVGASSYNLSLSQRRAEEIKKILLSNLIEEKKITNVDGKGELLFKTVSTSNPERIRALNRKVELSVSFEKLIVDEKEVVLVREFFGDRKLAVFNWIFLFNP